MEKQNYYLRYKLENFKGKIYKTGVHGVSNVEIGAALIRNVNCIELKLVQMIAFIIYIQFNADMINF